MKKSHVSYYLIESTILALGFFIVYSLQLVSQQVLGLIVVVLLYSFMGLIHHKIEHDMHPKIVLEYIIISILVVSLFIFVKSGTI